MHCYPWILVKADSRADAVEEASAWIDDQFEHGGGPYDYGVIEAEDEGRTEEEKLLLVLRGGTDGFREAVDAAFKTEARVLREHWDIAKQFTQAFEEPPVAGEKSFAAKYRLGWGIGPEITPAGTEIEQSMPIDLGYYYCGLLYKMRAHMENRTCTISRDAAFYDLRRETLTLLPADVGDDHWLVMANFHF